MKKTIYLTEDIEVLIASAGGVGTTFLIEAIQHFKTTNCPHNTDGYKHLPVPPLGGRSGLKAIYVFGDPVMAALSLFRRQYHNTQSHCTQKFEKQPDIIPMELTIDKYALDGKDRLHLADHFHQWHSQYTQYDTLFVRYEEIHKSVPIIADFAGLPQEFIDKFPAPRLRKSNTAELSSTTLAALEHMYQDLRQFQSTLASTSFVEEPGRIKRLASIVSPIYRRAYRHYLKRSRAAAKT